VVEHTPRWLRQSRHPGLWLILALAFGLRVWTLGEKNLWLDESASWRFATSSVADLFALAAADTHPPLYFLILKGWIALLGDSLTALRGLSVLAGVAAVYLTFRLAAACLPRSLAYAVAVWMAVSPHAIYFSQEARMYALATAAVLGACLSYRRWVDSGFTSRRALVMYAGCATVGLSVHYFTALPLAAIWLHAIVMTGRERVPWKPWLVAHAAIGVLYMPLTGPALAQIVRGQPWWRQPVTLGQIPDSAADLLRELTFSTYGVPILRTISGVLAVSVLAVGLVSLAARTLRRREERDVFVAFLAFTPVVGGLAVLPLTGQMELSRYLAYATPLLVLAAARGLGSLRLQPAHTAGILLIGSAALLPSLWTYYGSPAKDSDTRPIAAYLDTAARSTPGVQDRILVAPGYMTSVLRDVANRKLEYRGVDADADLLRLLAERPPRLGTTWLIVDYRWPGFEDLASDGRFSEQGVPSGMRDRIRLFRVRTNR
jgi:hypothetical protein